MSRHDKFPQRARARLAEMIAAGCTVPQLTAMRDQILDTATAPLSPPLDAWIKVFHDDPGMLQRLGDALSRGLDDTLTFGFLARCEICGKVAYPTEDHAACIAKLLEQETEDSP